LLPLARSLRRHATSAERRLWQGLRREQIEGFRFRRQVIVNEFIVDFVCYEARLAVEADGATHSTEAELARDAARSFALAREGVAVLRFSNNEVYHNLAGVLETIRIKFAELRPRIEELAP
jgi:very-short-patch-repair endonuclease